MKRIDLNDGWQFVEECNENFLKEKEYQGQTETVRIPHTCRTTPFNYFDESIYQMICGYRKAVDAPKEWEGKRILLTIGAAGHSAEVYVNGRFVMSHHCGYTAFTAELTGYLNYGG